MKKITSRNMLRFLALYFYSNVFISKMNLKKTQNFPLFKNFEMSEFLTKILNYFKCLKWV